MTRGELTLLQAFFRAKLFDNVIFLTFGTGLGAGLITCLIRYYGNYPEGVSFAILLMNILSPYIEKWTAPKALGGKKA